MERSLRHFRLDVATNWFSHVTGIPAGARGARGARGREIRPGNSRGNVANHILFGETNSQDPSRTWPPSLQRKTQIPKIGEHVSKAKNEGILLHRKKPYYLPFRQRVGGIRKYCRIFSAQFKNCDPMWGLRQWGKSQLHGMIPYGKTTLSL